jgi:dihydroflavonol-4-reductase
MHRVSLVTGANGHLGNNLVRCLAGQPGTVLAGTRNGTDSGRLQQLGCEVVHTDLLDKRSLRNAFAKVDVLYQVAAVFKHWAPDPQRDIYDANLSATRNVLEAAAEAGVEKIVYISSLAALDRSRTPITETTWNADISNVYFRSKTESEKLAWRLSEKFGLHMVSVLPGAMVGPNCGSLTPTMSLFTMILQGQLPADPGFYFNFVDVRDVAEGCRQAAEGGKRGERYLLANEHCTGVGEIVRLAQALFPERQIKTPARLPRPALYLGAALEELAGWLRRREPGMQRHFLQAFTVREECDITKARRELGFRPRPPREVIESTLKYLAAPNEETATPINAERSGPRR